jgi:hypothetical protein
MSENKQLTDKEIAQIVSDRVKKLYSGDKASMRTMKNRNPNSMIEIIINERVKCVGLYAYLPKELRDIINQKDQKDQLRNPKIMKQIADFLLPLDGKVTEKTCLFLDELTKSVLQKLSKLEECSPRDLKVGYNPRTWFNVSERQLHK